MALCTAKSKRGPCKQYAIRGGTVCKTHGGSAPQVKRAAALRLLAMVDPALDVLKRGMDKRAPLAVQLKAACEVLDRANVDLENKAGSGDGIRSITVKLVKAESANEHSGS
jgi:hypothetical protein